MSSSNNINTTCYGMCYSITTEPKEASLSLLERPWKVLLGTSVKLELASANSEK